MTTTLTQAERWLTLDTPLGEDVLVATGVRGVEGISRLFEFHAEALCEREIIAPGDLLGKSVTLQMSHPASKRRLVNGIVTAFSGGALTRSSYRIYNLTISPTFWVLDRTSDYKIFQDKTAVEIVEEILGEESIKFEKKLNATYDRREYCVQYGETNRAFVERLLAEEGIFYFFTHAQGAHTLVLADDATGYKDCLQEKVAYRADSSNTADAISVLDIGRGLTDTKWELQDYNFEVPSENVSGTKTTKKAPAADKSWSHFRFPGDSIQKTTLTRLSAVAVDASDRVTETISGDSSCASFAPGHRFTVEHPIDAENNKTYVLTEVYHEAYNRTHFTMQGGSGGEPSYKNRFTGAISTQPARSPLPVPRPIARGPVTAKVVGASQEEIHTDKYGRIRVQFFWDRYGKNNEQSSCFIRVAQSMAGSAWGSMFIPRVGMEVVVQFLDGDPDRPLVTGAVYNADNMPPWALPENMTKSGLLTRSTKDGQVANANELSFEDKKGSEKILFHAEKDFTREVENDDVLDVGHDQTRTIKNDRTSTITEGNDTFTIKKGNRVEKIETGNETLDIDKGNRTTTLGQGNDTLTLSQGNRTATLDKGNDALTVSMGNRTTTVDKGDDTLTVSLGNQTTKASAGKILLEAGQGITLKCGSSTIELTPAGINIKAVQITIKGDAKAGLQAPMVDVAGDGMVTVKGGIVKIN
ncbi:type VI secretion system tip protein TssI/VgrG [Rhizobium sp. LjRoot30]|uniref:type VI secretion system Vgr family protein n=1 Tax=Rhizobium sp. LjRoot30 TaxID=3342320 RepID=UPI003ECCD3F1